MLKGTLYINMTSTRAHSCLYIAVHWRQPEQDSFYNQSIQGFGIQSIPHGWSDSTQVHYVESFLLYDSETNI